MRFFLVVLVFFASAAAAAAGSEVCYFLDGARFERDAVASKGYVEIPLPAAFIPGSFRAKGDAGSLIDRIEIVASPTDARTSRELKALTERRKGVEDRLRALEVREEIFRAAARSQSSKAPRKTKNNPEPLDTIRKGTEYAVSQLEEVFRGRRRAEEGLKEIDQRLAALRRKSGAGGSTARVWLKGKGHVRYSFLVSGGGWTPFYDFRLAGKGDIAVAVRAVLPGGERGRVTVAASRLAEAGVQPRVVAVSGNFAPVANYSLPVERRELLSSLQHGIAVSFRNATADRLVAGEGACYLEGEYLGAVRFDGAAPGEAGKIAAGSWSGARAEAAAAGSRD
ncbi:hypothetical protein [Geobacter sp.]|uniref:hypothetical protein n=1 Tax=Geobacter sp. TaxID=46610 RepID=UPI002630AAD7|nr:hypothetical protein [Geobacter sp.]